MDRKNSEFIYDSSTYITPKIKSNVNNYNEERIKNLKLGKQIMHFIRTMKNNYSLIDLTTMYHNLETVIINPYFKPFNRVKGEYDTINNTIEVSILKPNAIYHELMHMASTICENNRVYSGFSISCIKGDLNFIGYALNEGFTQLYTKENFVLGKEKKYYPLYTSIADFIRWLIGDEYCNNLYFHSDLNGLIRKLEEYATFEEIVTFIRDLDIYSIKKSTCLGLIKEIYECEIKTDNEYMEEFYNFLAKLKENKEKLANEKQLLIKSDKIL